MRTEIACQLSRLLDRNRIPAREERYTADAVESYDALGDLLREAPHAEVDVLDAVLQPRSFRNQLARADVKTPWSWSVLVVPEGGEDTS